MKNSFRISHFGSFISCSHAHCSQRSSPSTLNIGSPGVIGHSQFWHISKSSIATYRPVNEELVEDFCVRFLFPEQIDGTLFAIAFFAIIGMDEVHLRVSRDPSPASVTHSVIHASLPSAPIARTEMFRPILSALQAQFVTTATEVLSRNHIGRGNRHNHFSDSFSCV